jgi:hypothetical protein
MNIKEIGATYNELCRVFQYQVTEERASQI